MSKEVKIIVDGPVGSGKSAILGEIEILMRALGIPYRYEDEQAAQTEKNMTHADWQEALEMYKPSVVLLESLNRHRWIPISERMPEKHHLVRIGMRQTSFDGYWDGEHWRVHSDPEVTADYVTHWMRLPFPPEPNSN